MEGFLDHLETSGVAFASKKVWTRRFFKLNATFHVLEFFTDATQQERKGKLELSGAVVASADELGELLGGSAAVDKARRFTFRLTECGGKKHHYLCADLAGADAASSRQYLAAWLQALQACISAQQDSPYTATSMGLGELNAQIGAFMNHMHLAARVSNRRHESSKSSYEITVKAWILERELVMDEEQQDDSEPTMSWQILEYSCAWKLQKSTEELRHFDSQLRQRFGATMRDVVFPPGTLSFHLHATSAQKEVENQQRLEVYDRYLQSLLRLPAFSVFGSDASTMLDTFLDVSPHLASFRKLEKESGHSMHLRDRKVVPWKDRERFEVVYKMHLQVVAAQEERSRRAEAAKAAARRRQSRQRYQHDESVEHSFHREESAPAVAPLPAPVKVDASIEESRPSESVRERIARIGHRLVTEAFEA